MKKKLILLVSLLCLGLANVMAESIDLSSVVASTTGNEVFSAENDATYPWTIQDGVLTSTNQAGNSYVTMTVNCTEQVAFTCNYRVSSEGNCDFIHITIDENDFAESGEAGSEFSRVLSAGSHTIKFGYTHDASVNQGLDCAMIWNIKFVNETPIESLFNMESGATLGEITNDGTYPWLSMENILASTNTRTSSTSTFTFAVDLDEDMYMSLDYTKYCTYNNDNFNIVVDDVTMHSFGRLCSDRKASVFIPAGQHVIKFSYTRCGYTCNDSKVSIQNIRFFKPSTLEDLVNCKDETISWSIENDATLPWLFIPGNKIVSPNMASKQSTVTLNLECDEPLYITYDRNIQVYNGGNEYFGVMDEHLSFWNKVMSNSNGNYFVIVPKGTHKLLFKYNAYYGTGQATATNNGQCIIGNIKIARMSSVVKTIDLASPGTLGEEALAPGRWTSLPAVNYLKVTGSLNNDDWAKIKQMTGLRYIDLSETTVKEIPASAFTSSNLNVIEFPAGLEIIRSGAFQNRPLLGDLVLPETVTTIESNAFYGNSYIKNVVLPDNVSSLGTSAFYSCNSMREFTFNDKITSVPSNCFQNCDSLSIVHHLDNITTVGNYAFDSCDKLKTMENFCALRIYDYAFQNCIALENIDLSKTSTFGTCAFNVCRKLPAVDLSSATSFGNDCFNNCDALTSVVLPDQVTAVSAGCFRNCDRLATVVLGASTTSLGNYAFYDSPVTTIYCNAPTPPSVSTSYLPFYYNNSTHYSTTTLYVPEYSMTSYKLNPYWGQFTTVEVNPNHVSDIVLSSALSLTTNVRIPDTPNLTMNLGSNFTVNGNNPQPLNRFVAYFSTSTNASLLSRCNQMTSNSAEARYSMNTGYWYFVTPSFNVNRADITTSNGAQVAIRYYDSASRANNGAGSSWKDVADNGVLEAGKGYIFYVSANCYVYLPATDATHNQIFRSDAVVTPLADYASAVSSDANWNLVGNPYPCYYDIYHMDFTAPITVWDTSNKTYYAYSIADDEFALRPMQAFFVQKPNGINNITFQTEGRQHSAAIDHSALASAKANMPSSRKVVNVTLSNGETTDMTRVVVNSQAADEFDAATDATKMMEFGGTAQIYSMVGDEMFSINEGKQANGLVNLGMWFAADGEYTIDITRADTDVELLDNGTIVAMPYTFRANSDYCEGRFALRIGGIVNSLETINAQKTDNNIYNVAGQKVQNLQKGIYIVNGKKVLK